MQAVGRRLQESGALHAAGVPAQVLGLEGQVRAQPEKRFIDGVFRSNFLDESLVFVKTSSSQPCRELTACWHINSRTEAAIKQAFSRG